MGLEGYRPFYGNYDPTREYKKVGVVEDVSLFCQSCFTIHNVKRIVVAQNGQISVLQTETPLCCDNPILVQFPL